MIPRADDNRLGRLLAHHADGFRHLRHVAGTPLREVAAEMIGVEVGRRSLRGAGQNERDQRGPKACHGAVDSGKPLRFASRVKAKLR